MAVCGSGNSIHWIIINCYPVDRCALFCFETFIRWIAIYPLDSDLSAG